MVCVCVCVYLSSDGQHDTVEGSEVFGVSHPAPTPRDVDVVATPPASAHPIIVSVLRRGEESPVLIAMEGHV